MTIYKISFYITKGDIEEIKRKAIPKSWVYGRDYSIEKIKLIPSYMTRHFGSDEVCDVGIELNKRDCKIDYLPWPHELHIGMEKTDELSYLMDILPNEWYSQLPRTLFMVCQYCFYQINYLITALLYICSKCQHINCQGGPCALCFGETIKIDKYKVR